MEEKDHENITIRNILDRNVNLLTVLGIFNGLAIYSSTIESKSIGVWLSFFFLFLSIIVLWVVLIDIPNNKLGPFVFQCALLMCQLLMVGFLVQSYFDIVVSMIFLGLLFLFIYLFGLLIVKTLFRKIKNYNFRKNNLHFLLLLVSLSAATILSFFLAKWLTILVKKVIEYFITNQ